LATVWLLWERVKEGIAAMRTFPISVALLAIVTIPAKADRSVTDAERDRFDHLFAFAHPKVDGIDVG